MEPLPAQQNTLLEFVDETIGTNVPKQFVPGVERGFREMAEKGMLSGHRFYGIRFSTMFVTEVSKVIGQKVQVGM